MAAAEVAEHSRGQPLDLVFRQAQDAGDDLAGS